jgi:predicted nucleic acid-binding protein
LSIYADSSFFVSLYVPDQHTPEARRRAATGPVLWMTPLHVAEWAHAIEQQVFRGAASRGEADRTIQLFHDDRSQGLWKEIALPERAFNLCAQLARQYAARLGTRTLDSLHVACALELRAERFWTFDQRQAKLARAAGLRAS